MIVLTYAAIEIIVYPNRMRSAIDLDMFDRKLVAILQTDVHRPVAQIAAAVGLSAPACYRRMRRLRDSGVIEREVAIVRSRALGWPLTLLVMVTLEREGPRTIEEMRRLLAAEPEVIEAWNVTGEYDLAVRVVSRDMESYDELVQRLFSANDAVRSFKTLVVIREVKPLSPIPVE